MAATDTRCRRCGRPLRVATSVARAVGPVCAKREALAAALEVAATAGRFSAEQAATAAEAFAERAVVLDLTGHPHALIAGTKGDRYRVATADLRCTCRAGSFGRRCWHQLAALAALQLGQAA